jgi:glycosyltransferase involved in cell wall biosynthesis
VAEWLPLSEGFVFDLISRSRQRSVVVSHGPLVNEDRYPHPGFPVRSLAPIERMARPVARRRATTGALIAIALAHRAAIFHTHFGDRAPATVSAARKLSMPFVVSLHGHDATAVPRMYPGYYDTVAKEARAVIVPSHFLADAVEGLGFPRDRIHVLPSGIDTGVFVPTPLPAGPPVAAFVGRLVDKKGVDVLLDAWPDVCARVPGARLAVLGAGESAALVQAAPDVEHIVPRPEDGRRQVRDLIARSSVVVTPSRTTPTGDAESLLLVNLEAQASGRPVVTTSHGGIPEYVRAGETALVVPEGDREALADALVHVLSDRELAGRLASAGPAWAARFDLALTTSAVDDLYEELLPTAPRWARITGASGSDRHRRG